MAGRNTTRYGVGPWLAVTRRRAPRPEPAARHKNVTEPSWRGNRPGREAFGPRYKKGPSTFPETVRSADPQPFSGGISPRRLAIILSTMRLGSTAVIRCRIKSGL